MAAWKNAKISPSQQRTEQRSRRFWITLCYSLLFSLFSIFVEKTYSQGDGQEVVLQFDDTITGEDLPHPKALTASNSSVSEDLDRLFIPSDLSAANMGDSEMIWVAPTADGSSSQGKKIKEIPDAGNRHDGENKIDNNKINNRGAQDVETRETVEEEKTSETLDVDDIRQFSEESSEVGRKESVIEDETPDESGEETDSFEGPVNWKEKWTESLNGEIDPYLPLFRNYEPTAQWAKEIEKRIQESSRSLEVRPGEARQTLREVADLIVRSEITAESLLTAEERAESGRKKWVDRLRPGEGFAVAGGAEKYGRPLFQSAAGETLSDDDATAAAVNGTKGTSLTDFSPEERAEILKTLRYRLDRRVFLWGAAANYFDTASAGRLQVGRDLTPKEIASLREKTLAVRNYFGIGQVGRRWRKNFEVDSLYEVLDRIHHQASVSGSFRPVVSIPDESGRGTRLSADDGRLRSDMDLLRDHINSICYKVRSTAMTADQKRIFESSVAADWFREMTAYACDQTDPYSLLWLYEHYEKTGGGDSGKELGKTAYRMKTSRSDACHRFGNAVNVIFNNPNVKIYVSQAFLNRFLPIRDPEFDVVQERILGNPVAGSRRTDTQVRIQLVPDSERLLMNLVVSGRIVASTRSDVFPAKVFNESYANYLGRKQIEWKNNGIVWSESAVDVNNTSQLSDVRTNIDFVPIVGSLAREVVKGEYQSRQEAIRQETRQRIVSEVKRRIDTETTERFTNVNTRLHQGFFAYLDSLGMTLSMQNSKTTEDWLLASLRLAEPGSLGSQTAEPPTLAGAFADIKVHESAINTALARLGLAGRDFTPRELTDHLAKVLDQPELAEKDFGGADLMLGMAGEDPVSVSFDEGQVRIRLRFESIEIGKRRWDDITVEVVYHPTADEAGNLFLVRGGVVSVAGPMNIRAQIPLRTLFSKVFSAEGKIAFRPKLFDQDERFAGLTTGLCRVTNGWLALSVVEKEDVIVERSYPHLNALRDKIVHRPRMIRSDKNPQPIRQAVLPFSRIR